ncbi:MAG: SIS domain-containing protein [Devosia sp.]|uniref:SIS domain-containing protein n=1 Tax=unclassified Devosia TaxID=196773 RepID=UPI00092CD9A9|nr:MULTISPECIES: SIS domain-containing protein [unclassified Devosia]MBL8599085.1 SIS domain-containing protein [Devosia sp.]MBN9345728.1 SIS domain-containing protein [Devosia sp.]OJX51625.1 MAG: aminotransferase [Devosia sp. 66-22]
MTANATYMRMEIDEIPDAAQRLLDGSAASLAEAGQRLRTLQPVMVATIARGSSDHAAAFLKYAIELTAGVPVASIGPSIMSIYGRELRLDGCAAISISQSGKSPDIVAMAQSARRNGALSIALTNTAGSPLAESADISIDLAAGKEQSVAATKSFVSSVVAGLAILSHWTEDDGLKVALGKLPEALGRAVTVDWTPVIAALKGHDSLYVLGRGPALAIAQEAALKFKETCGIHAEAYSAAEVLHGPARIVEAGFPVLALAARDASEAGVAEIADRLARQGATAFATTDRVTVAQRMPFVETGHGITDALVLIASFYGFVEMLSRHRGFDPDRPPHLKKVTETV